MNNSLLILGAGQYGMVAKEIAEAMKAFEKIDFLDDNSELAIGKLDAYEPLVMDYNYTVVAIGDSELRLKWIQKLVEACYRVAVLVHPSAYIAPSAQLQKGCIVEPHAVVQTNAALAVGVLLSAGAIVGHDSFVGDGCHIDTGAVIEPNSVVPLGMTIACGQRFGKKDCIRELRKCAEDYSFEIGV